MDPRDILVWGFLLAFILQRINVEDKSSDYPK
jgi:hypothetical protein